MSAEASVLRVLLTGPVPPGAVAEMRAAHPTLDFAYFDDSEAMLAELDGADIVLGAVPEAALARAGRLKWIHSWQAGPDRQIYPAIVEHPVRVTSSKGNGAIPLAEHAMLLMLLLNRGAMRWIEAQRARRWERFTHPELNGLTVGIVGVGNSGRDLALKAKAFHMRVIGMRHQSQPAEGFERIYGRDELHAFLAASDFVVMSAPLTEATRGMLGVAEFRAMKPSAYYICFSRGGIADDAALLRALREGWIAGAGLDAHGVEPLPAYSPFWSLPNVIVTPHNGATTEATFLRAYQIFRDNLDRFVAGLPLVNLVDKHLGY